MRDATHCVDCTCTQGIPAGGVFVFGSQLHTHLTGVRVVTRHVRAGRELAELNRDNHYSTHFQEIRRLKQPVHVLPVSREPCPRAASSSSRSRSSR